MMTEIPIKFRRSSGQKLVSFDHIDVATGYGYVTFYALNTIEDATINYHLSSNTFKGYLALSPKIGTTETTFTKIETIDFDSNIFDKPILIKGDVIIQSGFESEEGSDTGDGYRIMKLKKWDGTSETNIGQAQSETHDITGQDLGLSANMIQLSEAVEINAGDRIRLTIEVWAKTDSGAGSSGVSMRVGIDPANATEQYITKISFPIKVMD